MIWNHETRRKLYLALENRASSENCSRMGLEPPPLHELGIREVQRKLGRCLADGEKVFIPSPYGYCLDEQKETLFGNQHGRTNDLIDCLEMTRETAEKILTLGIP